jgi:hypothetical protein
LEDNVNGLIKYTQDCGDDDCFTMRVKKGCYYYAIGKKLPSKKCSARRIKRHIQLHAGKTAADASIRATEEATTDGVDTLRQQQQEQQEQKGHSKSMVADCLRLWDIYVKHHAWFRYMRPPTVGCMNDYIRADVLAVLVKLKTTSAPIAPAAPVAQPAATPRASTLRSIRW